MATAPKTLTDNTALLAEYRAEIDWLFRRADELARSAQDVVQQSNDALRECRTLLNGFRLRNDENPAIKQ